MLLILKSSGSCPQNFSMFCSKRYLVWQNFISMVHAQGSGSPSMVLPACIALINPSNCCPSQWTELCTQLINFSLNLFYCCPQFVISAMNDINNCSCLVTLWERYIAQMGPLVLHVQPIDRLHFITNVLRRLSSNGSIHLAILYFSWKCH